MSLSVTMQNKVYNTLQKTCRLSPEILLVVACSGGRDSMCLLHMMHELSQRYAIATAAIYIHHGLRKEADEEVEWLQKLCAEWEIPFGFRRVPVMEYAREKGCGTEDAARILRYEALHETALQLMEEGHYIQYRLLTAHHADDQAETFFLHLLRGSGHTGLCAMSPVNGLILRPMLSISRDEIQRYMEENHLSHREDATNQEEQYDRNWIRHRVIPLLQERYPAVTEKIGSLCQVLQEEESYLEEQVERYAKESIVNDQLLLLQLQQVPRCLQMRLLRRFVQQTSTLDQIGQVHLEALLDLALGTEMNKNGKCLDFPHQVRYERIVDRIVCKKEKTIQSKEEISSSHQNQRSVTDEDRLKEILIPVDGRWHDTGYGRMMMQIVDNPLLSGEKIKDSCYTKWLSGAIIGHNLTLRTRRAGDYLRNASGRTTLQDYMVNQKIHRDRRDRIPLLMDGQHCLWVIGHRLSEGAYVQPSEKQVIRVDYEDTRKEMIHAGE